MCFRASRILCDTLLSRPQLSELSTGTYISERIGSLNRCTVSIHSIQRFELSEAQVDIRSPSDVGSQSLLPATAAHIALDFAIRKAQQSETPHLR